MCLSYTSSALIPNDSYQTFVGTLSFQLLDYLSWSLFYDVIFPMRIILGNMRGVA